MQHGCRRHGRAAGSVPVLQLDRANHSTNDVTEVAESIYEKTGADEDLFTVQINPTRDL